jgi:hypothetical protein
MKILFQIICTCLVGCFATTGYCGDSVAFERAKQVTYAEALKEASTTKKPLLVFFYQTALEQDIVFWRNHKTDFVLCYQGAKVDKLFDDKYKFKGQKRTVISNYNPKGDANSYFMVVEQQIAGDYNEVTLQWATKAKNYPCKGACGPGCDCANGTCKGGCPNGTCYPAPTLPSSNLQYFSFPQNCGPTG